MNYFLHSWQLLLGISIVTAAFSTILQKLLVRDGKTDGVLFSIVFQIFVGVIIGVVALFRGFHVPNFSPYIFNVLIMILFYGFGNVCIFKAISLIEASEFTLIFTSRALWTIIASVIFLGEKFSFTQVIGTALIIGSVVLISLKRKKFVFNKGLLLTVLAGFFFGVAFTNDAFLLQKFDVFSYISIAFILPGLGMLFFYPKTLKKMHELILPGVLWKILLLSAIYSIAAMAIFAAYQVGRNSAQISAIDQTATVFTVLLAVVLLKEKDDILKKILATILAFVGIILLR